MKVLRCFLCVAGVAAIVCGRVETIDLTEGRALLAGWPYWLVGVLCIVMCCVMRERKSEE